MKVAIIGIGNILMGDEGVGIAVIEELRKMKINADIYDCGTMGIDILNTIMGYDKVIVVDAVKGFGNPGDVVKIRPEEIKGKGRIVSMHDVDFSFLIKIVEGLMDLPEIVIVGIEVERIGEGMVLSETVRKAIPKAVEVVLKELHDSNR